MIEKLKTVLKKTDIYLLLFSLLCLRAIAFDFNFAQALLAITFIIFTGYKMWLDIVKRPDDVGDLREEMNKLKQEVTRNNIKAVATGDTSAKRFF